MTTLYLIRHGATEQNEQRPVVLQGNGIDGPLSVTGQAQAQQVAGVLSRRPISAVLASPMLRARQTAAAIAAAHRLTVQTVAGLHEVDVGDWEGLSWEQIMHEQPVEYARFLADPGQVPYRGGESYGDVLQRAKPALLAAVAEHAGASLAVVAHNVVNRVLLADLIGLPLNRAKDLRQANCCINVIRVRNGAMQLVTMNAELSLLAGS